MIPIKLINDFYDTNVVEVEFSLFYHCNMNCDWCLQTPFKNDKTIDQCPDDWLQNAIDRFKQALPHYKSKRLRISLYGGELFQDRFTDDHIAKYDTFITAIDQFAKDNGYECSYELVTNLVYKKVDRMIDFTKRRNCSIATSFDFAGRFHKQSQFNLWKANVQYLIANNVDFGVIIIGHKQNLFALQNDLYDIGFFANNPKINVDIAEYDDVTNNPDYKPTTEQFIQFVKLLRQKYPKINLSIFGNAVRCGLQVLDISSSHTLLQRCDEVKLTEQIIEKFDCLSCPYKPRCVIVCPRKFLQNSFCPNKRLYEQV